MYNSNKKKDAQLGMAHGTATSQLRKILLFKYVTICGHNICFRCNKVIDNIDDFSIEHKIPWLDNQKPNKLFFDVDNIAFSHLKCNVPHRRSNGNPKKVGEEGTSWCTSCKMFKPIDCFYKNRTKWNGLHSQCKECRKKFRGRVSRVVEGSSL